MKTYKLKLSKKDAEFLTAGLIFCSSVDCCGNWTPETGKKFLVLAKKLRAQGIEDVSKFISISGAGATFDDPKLVKTIKNKFKVSIDKI